MTQSVTPSWRRRAPRNTQGFLSPAVRNAMRELGRENAGSAVPAPEPEPEHEQERDGDEVIPFSNIRRRTAVGLLASKRTIPHALSVIAADYGPI